MEVLVIYPKGSLRTGNDPEVANNPFRTESRLMPCKVSDTLYERGMRQIPILERIWRMFNRVDGSPIEHYLEEYQERSMMVGDLVKIGDDYYRCDFVGWKQVKASDLPDDIHFENN